MVSDRTQSEQEKMIAGLLYNASDAALDNARQAARRLTRLYNATTDEEAAARRQILCELLGRAGQRLFIEPPFRCDYGSQIFMGDDVYLNFDCVILDCAPVHLGDYVLCGPGVHLYTASHPIDAAERATGIEFAKPISIGSRVWLGGRTVVCPGVSIGEDSVVGAGSVVTRDLPAGVVAVGNPCRVVRSLK